MTCITVYHTPKVKVTVKCLQCNKVKTRVVGRHVAKKIRFCSIECNKKWHIEKKKKERRNAKRQR